MSKVKNLDELKKLREGLKSKLSNENMQKDGAVVIRVAMATCAIASGAKETLGFINEELEKRNIDSVIIQTGCMGYCYAEPTIEVTMPGKEPVVFGFVDNAKADSIIERYIKNGEMVEGIIPLNYLTIDE